MKYIILGFQQSKLLQNNLKTDDALILRAIKDMYSSASMDFKDFNGIRCMWINYTYFLEQIPIIGSKSNLMSKIKNYEKIGLIIRNLEKTKNGVKGNFAFIAPTKELDKLQDYDLMQNLDNPCVDSGQPLSKNKITLIQNLDNKDTSIKDTSIKDTSIKDTKDIKEVKLDVDKTLNDYTNNKDLKDTLIQFLDMRRKQKDGITDYGIKKMLTKLTKISKNDAEKIEILDNSIMCSYKGVFPLKNQVAINSYGNNKNQFVENCVSRDYDFNDLEKKLLGDKVEVEEMKTGINIHDYE